MIRLEDYKDGITYFSDDEDKKYPLRKINIDTELPDSVYNIVNIYFTFDSNYHMVGINRIEEILNSYVDSHEDYSINPFMLLEMVDIARKHEHLCNATNTLELQNSSMPLLAKRLIFNQLYRSNQNIERIDESAYEKTHGCYIVGANNYSNKHSLINAYYCEEYDFLFISHPMMKSLMYHNPRNLIVCNRYESASEVFFDMRDILNYLGGLTFITDDIDVENVVKLMAD